MLPHIETNGTLEMAAITNEKLVRDKRTAKREEKRVTRPLYKEDETSTKRPRIVCFGRCGVCVGVSIYLRCEAKLRSKRPVVLHLLDDVQASH